MDTDRVDIPKVSRCNTMNSYVANSSRSCICKGFLSRTSYDISPEMSQFQARQQTLPPALRLRVKWQDICIQCGLAASENGIRNLTPEQDRALSIIIKSYDLQIRDLECTAADGKCFLSRPHTGGNRHKRCTVSSPDSKHPLRVVILSGLYGVVCHLEEPVHFDSHFATCLCT
jgi:hypothetical protein